MCEKALFSTRAIVTKRPKSRYKIGNKSLNSAYFNKMHVFRRKFRILKNAEK
jgi:hypothetical protein